MMSDTRSERRARRNLSEDPLPDRGPPSPPTPSSLAGGGGWLPIDDKAKSGVKVEVRSARGEETQATWHNTRHFNAKELKWNPTAYWRHSLTGTPLWFEPVEYRPI